MIGKQLTKLFKSHRKMVVNGRKMVERMTKNSRSMVGNWLTKWSRYAEKRQIMVAKLVEKWQQDGRKMTGKMVEKEVGKL